MKNTASNLIFVALSVLAAAPAAAGGYGGFAGHAIGPVAELGAEERAWFRDQSNQLPPAAREALRQKLRDDWRDLPPEERQKRRSEYLERMRDQGGDQDRRKAGEAPQGGYGQGYETRQWGFPEMPGGRGRR